MIFNTSRSLASVLRTWAHFGLGVQVLSRGVFEILGIGVVDVDLHECMMLKAVQTTLDKDKENNDMSLYDWYAKISDAQKRASVGCITLKK